MHSGLVRWSVTAILCLGMGYSALAQDATKPTSSTAKPTSKAAKKGDDKIRGRLPNNFAKVGLSEEQRTRIYMIQAKYDSDIEKLEKQLAELKAKEKLDVHSVLNEEQKKKLAELEAARKTSDVKPATAESANPATPATPAKP